MSSKPRNDDLETWKLQPVHEGIVQSFNALLQTFDWFAADQ